MTYKLTRGAFQNITCYLAGAGQLPVTPALFYSPLPARRPLCGPVIGPTPITVPGSLRSSRLSDSSRALSGWGARRDVNECMPLMTERCALLVCIYVFKLPSAVRMPNDRRRNKRKSGFTSNLRREISCSKKPPHFDFTPL